MQQTIDLQMPLSENFRLGEFVTSATARRLNIDNTPSPQHIVALRKTRLWAEWATRSISAARLPTSICLRTARA